MKAAVDLPVIDEAAIAAAAGVAAGALSGDPGSVLALDARNCPAWLAVERAARLRRMPMVPVPGFYSPEQAAHAIEACGADILVVDREYDPDRHGGGWHLECRVLGLAVLRRPDAERVELPAGTTRITFTSGSTGAPKGVCLSGEHLGRTVAGLVARLAALGVRRHFCMLPFSILLEEVAGVGTALATQAELVVPDPGSLGFSGDGEPDPERLLRSIRESDAQSLILFPELLKALVHLGESGCAMPKTLRFAAVGGARVDPDLIRRARDLGLPVYEGYGLSECGSVVSLNSPGRDRVGSAGVPLPHLGATAGIDGIIRVRGASMLGYLGGPPAPKEWDTGDLGRVDDDGFLWVSGRCGTRFITGYGRNVSPEWPESLLLGSGVIAQAAVFGEAMPGCAAVLVPAAPEIGDDALQEAVDRANARLPGYARVHAWVRAETAFSPANGLATASGRPRREAIRRRYEAELASLTTRSDESIRQVQ